MVSNLADLGVRVPDGFATTAEAYRRFIGDTGLAETISSRLAGLDTDDVQELARAGKEIRDAVVAQPFPRGSGGRHPGRLRAARRRPTGDAVVRGPVLRDRGGSARCVLRRAAGDVPQRPRHRRDPDRDPGGVRLALQRPGHRLPGAPRLRARRGRAVGGRAADGALRRRRVGGDVHHGHRVRASPTPCSSPPPTGWGRPSCRAR